MKKRAKTVGTAETEEIATSLAGGPLSPHVVARLRAEAAKRGISIKEVMEQALRAEFGLEGRRE